MRWYFSFGYGFKEVALSLVIGDEEKCDLVGYGYDDAPIFRGIKIRILFIELVAGILIIE